MRIAKILLIISITCGSSIVGAITESDFEVKTTKSLLNLCTAQIDHPLHKQAVNFCHGYLVGAYHFYKVTHSGPGGMNLVCLPEPPPSRADAISQFIAWAKSHPEHMDETPVETEFRFLTETWPCK